MTYFITSNKGKFEEARKIVPELEMLEIDLPEEQEVDQQKIVEKKLAMVADYLCSSLGRKRLGAKQGKVAYIVEDTGFYLDSLPGLPGPLIKWFLKTIGRKGIYEICKKFDNYKAEGKSIIGYRSESGEIKFFTGVVRGNVVLERGEDGFGWDPVFVPDGEERTFAEMSREKKNEISMRRKAFEELKNYLSN